MAAATRSIDQDQCSVSRDHLAYDHLSNMRGWGLAANVIDSMGNFVDEPGEAASVSNGPEAKEGSPPPTVPTLFEGQPSCLGANLLGDTVMKWFSTASLALGRGTTSEPWPATWEWEFSALETPKDFFLKQLMIANLVVVLNWVCIAHVPIGDLPEHCPAESWFTRGVLWRYLLYSPLLLGSIVSVPMFWVTRNVSTGRYVSLLPALLVIFWLMNIFGMSVFIRLQRDLTRMWGGHSAGIAVGKCALISHVSVAADYSRHGSLWAPVLTCADRNPLKTVLEWPFPYASGCASHLFDATCPMLLEVFAFFLFLRCHWTTTATATALSGILLAICFLATGMRHRHILYNLTFFTCVGSVQTFLCYVRTQDSRDKFAKIKHVKFAAKQSRQLLYTLIPPNVLSRLASHRPDDGVLATDIQECSIMFCSLALRSGGRGDRFRREKDRFKRLHAVCLDLDAAVKGSPLYKYQHVGPWYIIACPNAAAPFGSDFEDSPTPPATGTEEVSDAGAEGSAHVVGREDGSPGDASNRAKRARGGAGGGGGDHAGRRTYCMEMAILACKFRSIADDHGFDLQVGMHAGCAAGAVIGSLRSFYCIYGETVNLASRLCKLARAGQIRCSRGFVSSLDREASAASGAAWGGLQSPPAVSCASLGVSGIKGFDAPMETFDVSVAGVEAPRCLYLPLWAHEESFNVDAAFRPSASGAATAWSRRLSEVNESMESLLSYSDLSAESLALLHDKKLAIAKGVGGFFFSDSAIEDEYLADNLKSHSSTLHTQIIAGIIVHLAGMAYQYLLISDPEHPYNFDMLGAGLTAAHASICRLFEVNLKLSAAACLVLALTVKVKGAWRHWVEMGLGLLRLSWLLLSVYASQFWPERQYTLIFVLFYSLSNHSVSVTTVRLFVVLFLVFNAIYLFIWWLCWDIMALPLLVRALCSVYVSWYQNHWAEEERRTRWRLNRVFQTEMKRFDDILKDLLPLDLDCDGLSESHVLLSSLLHKRTGHQPGSLSPRGAAPKGSHANLLAARGRMMLGFEEIFACYEDDAIVLQLDLCGFTEFSHRVSPVALARALHQIFSDFDTAVTTLKLFKMDTVGDAYIVAAWLTPHRQGGMTAPHAHKRVDSVQDLRWMQQAAHKMLWLAGSMLETIDVYNAGSAQPLQARIGIGCGSVVVGTLGSLQPRIHIRGHGMVAAERLEEQSSPGKVHVQGEVLDNLFGRTPGQQIDDAGKPVANAAAPGGGGGEQVGALLGQAMPGWRRVVPYAGQAGGRDGQRLCGPSFLLERDPEFAKAGTARGFRGKIYRERDNTRRNSLLNIYS